MSGLGHVVLVFVYERRLPLPLCLAPLLEGRLGDIVFVEGLSAHDARSALGTLSDGDLVDLLPAAEEIVPLGGLGPVRDAGTFGGVGIIRGVRLDPGEGPRRLDG